MDVNEELSLEVRMVYYIDTWAALEISFLKHYTCLRYHRTTQLPKFDSFLPLLPVSQPPLALERCYSRSRSVECMPVGNAMTRKSAPSCIGEI
jgi:hypothetical protein